MNEKGKIWKLTYKANTKILAQKLKVKRKALAQVRAKKRINFKVPIDNRFIRPGETEAHVNQVKVQPKRLAK